MPLDRTDDDLSEGLDALRHAIMVRILYDVPNVNARIAASLQQVGLLKDAEHSRFPDNLAAVLRDSTHALRQNLGDGPLLFLAESSESRAVWSVADLLLCPAKDTRLAALDFFKQLSLKPHPCLTPKTLHVLNEASDGLASDEGQTWRGAGIKLADTLEDDWLMNLGGAAQSGQVNFQDGIGRYLTRVMRPTVSSIDSIQLAVRGPADETDALLKCVRSFVQDATALTDAMESFYERLGYLPLKGEYGLGRLIAEWESARGTVTDVWAEVWNWADSVENPLPRYHACLFFIQQPDRIPRGKKAVLWREIADIMCVKQDQDSDCRWSEYWRVLCSLARHFCAHLSFQSQGQCGEGIAAFSWWLARKTLSIFDPVPEVLKAVREVTAESELAISANIWALSHPHTTPSLLHYATMNIFSVWSRAIFSAAASNFSVIDPSSASAEDKTRISASVPGFVLAPIPDSGLTASSPYGFSQPLLDGAKEWATQEQEVSKRDALTAYVAAMELLSDSKNLVDFLKTCSASDDAGHLLAAGQLRALAYSQAAPLEELWDILSDESLREDLFSRFSPKALPILLDGLTEIAVQQGHEWDKWATHLPHYLASACENATTDEYRGMLFIGTVVASTATDSASAIRRVLIGQHRMRLAEDMNEWRNRFEETWEVIPPWVQSRFRGTLAALHTPT